MGKILHGSLATAAIIISAPLLWIFASISEELWNTWVYRYRLTIQISESGRVHTGSSVVQVRIRQASSLFPQPGGVRRKVIGEAVVLELGNRGTLFALLRDVERPFSGSGSWQASAEEIVQHAFPAVRRDHLENGLANAMQRYSKGGKTDLAADKLPLLVRFRDLHDPKTVEVVVSDKLADSFGPNTVFLGATIEMVKVGIFPFNQFGLSGPEWLTGVPVTRAIKQKLQWLDDDTPERRLIQPVDPYDYSSAARLTFDDFLSE